MKTTHPHYFTPDTLGDRCLHCDKAEGERPHVALPSAWIPVLRHVTRGDMAVFQPKDVTERTRYDDLPLVGGNVVRALLGTRYIERVTAWPSHRMHRGSTPAFYQLTARGRAWVEEVATPVLGGPPEAAPQAAQGSP